ncbi:MAG TPA: pirin family protein [Burkholderiales bacterium]|nr:pirin family protein [Burkholderiales bacterium]
MNTRFEPRSALRVIDSHYAEPAPGLRVLRPFPGPDLDYASPFLMLDHFGPERIRPGDEGGLNPHPHRGFETVTFLFQGAMEHHDSSGGHGHLCAGGVQWMTAGSGIVHAEYREKEFARTGGVLEGVQLWVNLPRKFKMEAPHYQDLPAEKFAVAKFPGGQARVVAGELLGVRGPARPHVADGDPSSSQGVRATRASPVTSPQAGPLLHGPARPHVAEEGKSSMEGVRATRASPVTSPQAGPLLHGPARTYTPIIVAHMKLEAGASVELPIPASFNAYVYAVRGSGRSSTVDFATNQLVEYRGDGGSVQVSASEALDFLLLAGEPIDEPVVSWGPFVMNTREEILQARDDYLAGRMGVLEERS